jgi:hypothetical protein
MKSLFNDEFTGAIFSEDRRYRYELWRVWDSGKPMMMFVGLNPSTADETEPDNTVTRCMGFANSWGFGGMYMMNLFAYRATKPKDMFVQDDPVGPDTDYHLKLVQDKVEMILLAWGNHGTFMRRDHAVLSILHKNVHYLRKTKAGNPEHPLYLPKTLVPIPF